MIGEIQASSYECFFETFVSHATCPLPIVLPEYYSLTLIVSRTSSEIRTHPYSRFAHQQSWLRSRRTLRLPLIPNISTWHNLIRGIRVGDSHPQEQSLQQCLPLRRSTFYSHFSFNSFCDPHWSTVPPSHNPLTSRLQTRPSIKTRHSVWTMKVGSERGSSSTTVSKPSVKSIERRSSRAVDSSMNSCRLGRPKRQICPASTRRGGLIMVSSASVVHVFRLTRITTGTCVIDIGMLYIYWPGAITEIKPVYEHTDIAVFNQIVNAAISVVSMCVESRQPPVAGWTSTGMLAQRSPQDRFFFAVLDCV